MTDFKYVDHKWYQAATAAPIFGTKSEQLTKGSAGKEIENLVSTARIVGQNLADREVELFKAYAGENEQGQPIINTGKKEINGKLETDGEYQARIMKEDRSVQAAIQAKTILHQNAQRMYQMFSNMMDSMHQVLMKQIDRIRA